jgi:putative transposase
LEDVLAQSCGRGVGGVGPAISYRSVISSSVLFLPSSTPSLKSRKVLHVNVTRSPTDSWVAQQLREATPYGERPRYLLRDSDRKFGPSFARGNNEWHQSVTNTVPDSRRANAICERFLGSVRRECLNHFLIFHEKQLHRLLNSYVLYFNQARPHQGLGQRIPDPPALSASVSHQSNKMISVPVLGGLHHDYQRAA